MYRRLKVYGFISLLLLSVAAYSFFNVDGNRDPDDLVAYFNQRARALTDSDDIDELIAAAGNKSLVLLGESTHGTTEYYSLRSLISRRLIDEKGFSYIAVEGDFAAIYRLNKYVKHMPGAAGSAREVLEQFNRWPIWMWANEDIVELAEWMRNYNSEVDPSEMVGIYGMDVYGHLEAMIDLDDYVRENLPQLSDRIEAKLLCFARFSDEQEYARAAAGGSVSCREELEAVTRLLEENEAALIEICSDQYFRAVQNSFVARGAEAFYRQAPVDYNASWNSRATHMWHTVQRIAAHYGEDARGVVWAHNTHIGDARATAMGAEGMVNIGSLSRSEGDRDEVIAVGFGTYRGRVAAGSFWGSRMQIMDIPPGIEGSYENIFGNLDLPDFYLIFDDDDRANQALREFRGHRAIGVVYNPAQEVGNYVPTVLPERYDAFIFIRETNELVPVGRRR